MRQGVCVCAQWGVMEGSRACVRVCVCVCAQWGVMEGIRACVRVCVCLCMCPPDALFSWVLF